MLRLSCKLGKLGAAPVIELLPNENKRDDYVEAADFARLLTKFHDLDVRDLVEFQYASGWRVGSIMRLEKKDIDWQRETVKLRDAISKNKQASLLSFKKFPSMRAVLLRRKEKLRLNRPFIFIATADVSKIFETSGSGPRERPNSPGFRTTLYVGAVPSICPAPAYPKRSRPST
jgi:integrase